MPMKAVMLCIINGDTFYSFTKNASCYITIDDTGLFDIIDINESIQRSSGNMPVSKKGKLCINVWQVDSTELVHTLWPVKFCLKAVVYLHSLTCELLQGNKNSSNHQNNIMVKSSKDNVILDHQIKTNDGWVAEVEFLWETTEKRAQFLMPSSRKISMTSK